MTGRKDSHEINQESDHSPMTEQSICNRGDEIKTQYLADGGKEEDWGMDFWGMVRASMKVTGVWEEYVANNQ